MENKTLPKENKGFHRFLHLESPYPAVYGDFQLLHRKMKEAANRIRELDIG